MCNIEYGNVCNYMGIWEMTRGFTLLELLITVAVVSLLMVWAVPSYTNISDSAKMQRLAKELSGFAFNAKSEAVLRRQYLWVHFINISGGNSAGDWSIELTDSDTEGLGDKLQVLSGEPFKGITIYNESYSSDQISFDNTHGSPKSGTLSFYLVNDNGKQLNLKTHNRSGIIRICSPNSSELYGYEAC